MLSAVESATMPARHLNEALGMEWTRFIWNLLHRAGRTCLHCGSADAGDSQFCPACESALLSQHAGLKVFLLERGMIHGLCLFDWYPDLDRKVSKMLIHFKEGALKDASRFYTRLFFARLHGNKLPSNSVLVPCPSRLASRRHSQVLAADFSDLLGIPVAQILRVEPQSSTQKEKSLFQRFSTSMELVRPLENKHVIFIDDIVTTGATALAARKALGPRNTFEVWCLAHRCQLATHTNL